AAAQRQHGGLSRADGRRNARHRSRPRGDPDRRFRAGRQGRRRSRHRRRARCGNECDQRCAAPAWRHAAHAHAVHAWSDLAGVGTDRRIRAGLILWQSVRSASKPSRKSNERTRHMNIKVGKQAIAEATQKLKNWGRWGKDDQIGTLNHVTPEDIVKAARLIRTGKVFALGIPLDSNGPQTGLFGGRFNPIHQMLATGTDAVAGRQDWNKIRYADDTLNLCVQGATHWDALGHIFYEERAYNGYDAKLIDAKGLNVLGIEHSKSKMVGRGVLLDIARFRGVEWLKDGEAISNDELDQCAKKQKVE